VKAELQQKTERALALRQEIADQERQQVGALFNSGLPDGKFSNQKFQFG
jgi:very-short-patch-repair endonuclease